MLFSIDLESLNGRAKLSKLDASELNRIYRIQEGPGYIFSQSIHHRNYVTLQSGKLLVVNDLKDFKELGILKVSQESVNFLKRFGFIYPPYTLYEGVFIVPPFLKASFSQGTILFDNFSGLIAEKDMSSEEFIDPAKFVSELRIDIKNYFSDNLKSKAVVLFSGGIDSSVLLGIAKELDLIKYALTCEMPSLPAENQKAKSMCLHKNIDLKSYSACEDFGVYADEFLLNTLEPISDQISLIMPAMMDFAFGDNVEGNIPIIIDGQGADSLFSGLPHDKVVDLYSRFNGGLLAKLFSLAPIFEKRNNRIERFIYRISKVCRALSQKNYTDLLIETLVEDSKVVVEDNNVVYSYMKKEIRKIFGSTDDVHVVLRFVFLFRIVFAREMQKYLMLKKRKIDTCLPFLEEAFIKKYFWVNSSQLIDARIYKRPLFDLAKLFWPGRFKGASTSPFVVNYNVRGCSVKEYSIDRLSSIVDGHRPG